MRIWLWYLRSANGYEVLCMPVSFHAFVVVCQSVSGVDEMFGGVFVGTISKVWKYGMYPGMSRM
jgi:hypothetical protein